MAQNLNFETKDSWCYNNNISNCSKYGCLYNWEAAKIACPTGWHLPSKEEFETLLSNVGRNGNTAYKSLIKGGNSGFSAMFGGSRGHIGSFNYIGETACFWSSSPSDEEDAWGLNILTKIANNIMSHGHRSTGFSVRCLKDN